MLDSVIIVINNKNIECIPGPNIRGLIKLYITPTETANFLQYCALLVYFHQPIQAAVKEINAAATIDRKSHIKCIPGFFCICDGYCCRKWDFLFLGADMHRQNEKKQAPIFHDVVGHFFPAVVAPPAEDRRSQGVGRESIANRTGAGDFI